MANGMGSLYIGSSGLRTSQNALNTTANNLANVDTTGYVRQQVIQADRHYNTFDKNADKGNENESFINNTFIPLELFLFFICVKP